MKKAAKPKFNFADLKAAATHEDIHVRAKAFAEYFSMFNEFPSYLYDNSAGIDETLLRTVEQLRDDPTSTKEMRAGIELLLNRLPSVQSHESYRTR